MTAAAKVRRDLLLAVSVHGYQKFTGLIAVALLARHLDVELMGRFFFAATIATVAGFATELGTTRHLVARASVDRAGAVDELSQVLALRLPLIAVVFLSVNAIAAAVAPALSVTLLLTSVYILLQELYHPFAAIFIGARRVDYRFVTGATGYTLLLVAVYTAIALDATLPVLLGCYIGANAVALSAAAWVMHRRFGRIRLPAVPGRAAAVSILRDSLPFFALIVLSLLHFRIDVFMLGTMASLQAVAYFEAGNRLLEASRFVIRPVSMVFFPLLMLMSARGDWSALRSRFHRIVVGTSGAGVLVAVAVTALAPWLLALVFGERYAGAAAILRVLFLSAPFVFATAGMLFLARVMHAEIAAIPALGLSVAANVALNFVLIPHWGALGAAWATVATQIMLALWLLRLLLGQLAQRVDAGDCTGR